MKAATLEAPPRPSESSPVNEAEASTSRGRGVTPRVVILSLMLAVVFGYLLPVIDYKLNNTFLGGAHLPPGAVGVLLILVLVVNPLMRLVSQKLAFSRNEALTVYIGCLFSSLVPGHGSENFLIPNLLAPFYFATRENKWLDFLQPYLKPWVTPAVGPNGELNRAVYESWYVGLRTGESIPWAAWLAPLTFWISFTLISYTMLGCLSVMLRAQWAEKEALAFPLLRLPLQMTEDLDRRDRYASIGQFFRNPMMWAGFGVAVVVQGLRGLNLYFPDVPTFPLEINMGPLFSEAPWNQIGWVPVNVYPMVVGVTFLLTSEISFSLWFFYWFIKLQFVVAYYVGFPPGTLPGAGGFPDKVFTGYQVGGCYLAYVAIVLWTARSHLGHVAQRALGRVPAGQGEREEMMSYPLAFWGFVVSFAIMVGATCATGVRIDVALALWVSYVVFAIGLTRVAVEGGMLALQHHTLPLGAIAKLINTGPSTWLTPATGIVPASLFQSGFVFHMRSFIMPSFLMSFKLAHDRKIAAKPLGIMLVAVIAISVLVSWLTVVKLGYDSGGLQMGHIWWAQDGPKSPAHFITGITKSKEDPAAIAWLWMGIGGAFTYLIMLARSRLTAFPLHPVGYLMALSYPSATFWVSIFLGWLFKVTITRFGGNESYRKTIPLFLGLVLGDVAMILFWLMIDGWQGRTKHLLMPG